MEKRIEKGSIVLARISEKGNMFFIAVTTEDGSSPEEALVELMENSEKVILSFLNFFRSFG